jgi:hypothetical protein
LQGGNGTFAKHCAHCTLPIAKDLHSLAQMDSAGSAFGSKVILLVCCLCMDNLSFFA